MTKSSSSTKIALLALLPTVISQGASSTGAAACAYINGFQSSCAGGNPDFTLLPFTSQASCLCYYSTAWNPDNYDSAFTTCISHIKTALPSDYFKITSFNGGPLPTAPCRGAGNVRHYSELKIDDNLVACNNIAALADNCSSKYPSGFALNSPFQSRAPCLCYRNADPNSYIGPIYDSSAFSCFKYYSTADPVVYSSLLKLNGGNLPSPPCQSVRALSTSRSEPKPSTSSSPSPGSSPTPVVARPTSSTSSKSATTTSATTTSTTTGNVGSADIPPSLTGSAETGKKLAIQFRNRFIWFRSPILSSLESSCQTLRHLFSSLIVFIPSQLFHQKPRCQYQPRR